MKPAPQVPGMNVLGTVGRTGAVEGYLAHRTGGPLGTFDLVNLTRLAPGWDEIPAARTLFGHEGTLTCGLKHPRLIGVQDVLSVGEDSLLVMDFVEGRNVLAVGRACHALRASFPFALLGFTMLETARGLLAALSLRSRANVREVATLALSADTIIITYDGQVRVPVLCSIDALAALEVGLEMLPPSRVACLAPEILGRGAVDSRAEVFALGVTLYELLTHALPFQGRTAAEMARSVEDLGPLAPSTINPSIPKALEALCLRMLEKAPARRATLQEVVKALEDYTAGHPKACHPDALKAFMNLMFPAATDHVRNWMAQLRSQAMASRETAKRSAMSTVPLMAAARVELATVDLPRKLADDLAARASEFEDAGPTIQSGPPPQMVRDAIKAMPRPSSPPAAPSLTREVTVTGLPTGASPSRTPAPRTQDEAEAAEWLAETRRMNEASGFADAPTRRQDITWSRVTTDPDATPLEPGDAPAKAPAPPPAPPKKKSRWPGWPFKRNS